MNEPTNQTPENVEEVQRVIEAAKDSITDDMVARLAENVSQALDLLDRVNRSGLSRALPALADLVNNGDLDRLVSLARVYGSAEDAVTDEMVGRLTETIGGGLALLDQVNRSQLGKALPIISQMVENGDLARVADLARLVGAAQDALNDDMVGRLAETIGEAVGVVDRLNRSGVGRLVDILDRLNSTGALDRVADSLPKLIENLEMLEQLVGCLDQAARDVKDLPAPGGGILPLLRMMRDPANQAFMQFAFALGRRMQDTCTKRSR